MVRDRVTPRQLAVKGAPDRWADETTLVRALVEGDPDATAVALNRYAPLVFGIVKRALGRDSEAEDLTQEILGWFFRRIGTLRDPRALEAFVRSVALRVLKWELRRRRSRRFLTLSSTGQLPDGPAIPDGPGRRYAMHHLQRALNGLGRRERAVLLLRYGEGMTVQEVAAATGISTATVKRTLQRAAQRLRDLAGHDVNLHDLLGR